MEEKIKELKELIDKSKKIVVFTGAGVSTESGIPDFRSKDGLYNEKDNILNVESNMSRLNIKVKDTSIVNKDAIEKLGAKGIVEIDNELKIIMGPNSKQLKKYIKDLK